MTRFAALRIVALLGSCLFATACTSTANVRNVAVASPPPATTRLAVSVEPAEMFERGEATTLQNGLVREFRSAGYVLGDGGFTVHARIIGVSRGSTIANATVGMGIGRDSADVAVEVEDAEGKRLMSFTVHGEALDKRYTDLHDVLAEDVPEKIREQLQLASR